jgi:DNA-binding MarR family transcriptional regulator
MAKSTRPDHPLPIGVTRRHIRRNDPTARTPPPPDTWSKELADAVAPVRQVLLDGAMLRRPLEAVLRARSLPPLQLVELLWLLDECQRTAGDVAIRLGIAPSTASRFLDRAEAALLVDKVYAAVDGRRTLCRLSVRGRALLPEIDLALAEALDTAFEATLRRPKPFGPFSRMLRGIRNLSAIDA